MEEAPGLLTRGRVCRVCVPQLYGEQVDAQLCAKAAARYTCPACNVPYCSSGCFKAHDGRCTEGFYESQVRGQLRAEGVDVAGKKRALGLLAAVRAQDASDDATARPLDPLAALEERANAAAERCDDGDGGLELEPARAAQLAALAGGDDPDGLTLEALTLDEQRAFLRAVAAGDPAVSGGGAPGGGGPAASPLADGWRPWWEEPPSEHHRTSALARATGPASALIEEVQLAAAVVPNNSDARHQRQQLAQPAGSGDPAAFVCTAAWPEGAPASVAPTADATAAVPPFRALSPPGPPSPLLPVLVVDVLYAYAHAQRLYGGDWGHDAPGGAGVLLAVSQVLAADARPPTVAVALAGAMAAAVQPGVALTPAVTASGGGGGGSGVSYAVAADVAAVLAGGPHYVSDALAHARACVQAALAALDAGDVSERGGGATSPSFASTPGIKAAAMARRSLTAASRKLLFYLAWAREPAHAASLAPALASVAAAVLGAVREHAVLMAEGAAARQATTGGGIRTRG